MESEHKPFDDDFIAEKEKEAVRVKVLRYAREGRIDSQNSRVIAEIAEAQYERIFPLTQDIDREEESLSIKLKVPGIYRLLPRRLRAARDAEEAQITKEKVGVHVSKMRDILLGGSFEYAKAHPDFNQVEFTDILNEQFVPMSAKE